MRKSSKFKGPCAGVQSVSRSQFVNFGPGRQLSTELFLLLVSVLGLRSALLTISACKPPDKPNLDLAQVLVLQLLQAYGNSVTHSGESCSLYGV